MRTLFSSTFKCTIWTRPVIRCRRFLTRLYVRYCAKTSAITKSKNTRASLLWKTILERSLVSNMLSYISTQPGSASQPSVAVSVSYIKLRAADGLRLLLSFIQLWLAFGWPFSVNDGNVKKTNIVTIGVLLCSIDLARKTLGRNLKEMKDLTFQISKSIGRISQKPFIYWDW